MRKKFKKIQLFFYTFAIVCTIIVGNISFVSAHEREVYLGGMPAGFTIQFEGAQIVGFCEILTQNGSCCPAKNSGLQVGDIILSYGGMQIHSALDIDRSLELNNNQTVTMKLRRNGEVLKKSISAEKDKTSDKYKLGVLIRDCVSGIGTVTYIEKESGKFGSLGHAICDDNGIHLSLNNGKMYPCSIVDVVRGERGRAGELKGLFINGQEIGYAESNSDFGIFGTFKKDLPFHNLKTVKIETSAAPGEASILTTVNGINPEEYAIQIIKVDEQNRQNKNFVIKITDPKLLAISGGIVQGMSGSPILQHGKLVGAVTHVFVNDPTRGFGISIQNMLNG